MPRRPGARAAATGREAGGSQALGRHWFTPVDRSGDDLAVDWVVETGGRHERGRQALELGVARAQDGTGGEVGRRHQRGTHLAPPGGARLGVGEQAGHGEGGDGGEDGGGDPEQRRPATEQGTGTVGPSGGTG